MINLIHLFKWASEKLNSRAHEQTEHYHKRLNQKSNDSYDVIAKIRNCRFSKAIFEEIFTVKCMIRSNCLAECIVEALDINPIDNENSVLFKVSLPNATRFPDSLWVGRTMELYEGKRVVGKIEITDILNPILNRNRSINNEPDILMDFNLLNAVLKMSLEWGMGFGKPLDNKIMRTIPRISGSDIDKVAKFVMDVRDDVIWRIYYDHYDYQSESFSIDVHQEITQKYPWINKSNLASLESQGRYYSWHG